MGETSYANNSILQVEGSIYKCELCQKHGKCGLSTPATENCKSEALPQEIKLNTLSSERQGSEADGPFDPLQYQQQTGGFDSSLAYLKSMYLRDGPCDGILGFSQGASIAALVLAHKDKLKGEMSFRFAILCSGFALNLAQFEHGSINCPSLHILESGLGTDRQIPNKASADLAEVALLFNMKVVI
ncbi:hypothetical protein NL676_020010 [Syzygium grande]|nr:hypothetical protein NL676_020010 [Syzygium grande]